MTNLNSTILISLSDQELYFLASQFGQVMVMGWDDPYKGWLIDEIEEDQLKAMDFLLKKDYIRKVSDKEISMDQVLAAIVETCVLGEYALIISSEQKGGFHRQLMVHFKEDFIVEHVVVDEGHELTAIRDQSLLEDRYQRELRLETKTKGSGESFSLLEDRVFDLESDAADEQEIGENNSLHQGDGESIERLRKALEKPIANSSVVAIANRQDKYSRHVRGMAFLETEHDLWTMQPYDRNGKQWVEFSPADGEIIRKKFLELLPREM